MNATTRLIAATFMTFAFWISGAGTAAAHTALIDADPGEGSTVPALPSSITLTFSEDIAPAFANVVLKDAKGQNLISDKAQVTGKVLTATLVPERPAGGVYTVGYRVVSADGHPVSGSYTFTISASSAENSPTSTPARPPVPTSTTPPQPFTGDRGISTSSALIWAAIAGFVVGGLINAWQSRKRRTARHAGSPTDAPKPHADDGESFT